MTNYIVVYSREFNHQIECDSLETAHIRSKNFAIGMTQSMGTPIKILSIHAEDYVASTAAQPCLTFYEKMVAGMRANMDELLK